MAHTHLYVTLVQAYEDQRRLGVVAADARLDFKMKTDVLVAAGGRLARVDLGGGDAGLLGERAATEGRAKANASASSHAGQPFLAEPVFPVLRSPDTTDDAECSGLPLLRPAALDDLIARLDRHLGVPPGCALAYARMRRVDMAALRELDARGAVPTLAAAPGDPG